MAEHVTDALPKGAVSVVPAVPGALQTIEVHDPAGYLKFAVPFIAAGIVTFQAVYGHGNMLFVVLSIVVALAQAFLTWSTSNADSGFAKLGKFWVNVAGTLAQAVLAVVGSGGDLAHITPQQWAAVALAALSALGVGILPNTAPTKLVTVPTGAGVPDISSLPPVEPEPAPFSDPSATIAPADFPSGVHVVQEAPPAPDAS